MVRRGRLRATFLTSVRGEKSMAQVTVRQLAEEVGIPVERLLTQLEGAGIEAKGADQGISDEQKMQLLKHLRSSRSSARKGTVTSGEQRRVSLRRKSTSELKLGGRRGSGSRTVSVEVRKRRVYA